MPSKAIRVLAVGKLALGTNAMLARLATRGWMSRTVETLQEAQDLLETFRFEIALAAETLPDGRGYELSRIVARHSGTLMVSVALSESCLWLPVVERGAKVLGQRALNANMIEMEIERALSSNAARYTRALGPGPESVVSARGASPRRKSVAVA